MHEVKVKEEVFGVKLTVLNGTSDEMDDRMASEFPGSEGMPFDAGGFTQVLVCRESGLTDYVVLISPFTNLANLAATLVHECIHVAISALKRAGIKWDDEELICYYSQYFFGRAYAGLIKSINGT